MTLIPDPDPLSHPDEVRRALEGLPDLNVFRAVSHAPTLLLPWLGLGGAIFATLQLDPVLRELAVLQVAAVSDSAYERGQHEAIAASLGATAAQIDAIRERRLDDPSLVSFRQVLEAVGQTVQDGRASTASLSVIRKVLGDRQTVELLMVIGFYIGVAVLTDSIQLDRDTTPDTSLVATAADVLTPPA